MNYRFPFFVILSLAAFGSLGYGLFGNRVTLHTPPSSEDLDASRKSGLALVLDDEEIQSISEIEATDWMSKERLMFLSDYLRAEGVGSREVDLFVPDGADLLLDSGKEAFCYT